ncbi:MAG: hypothetical protein FJZ01_24890 [Candidatus Sericytochromatia bacterium]|nr:hypothetical protein [Candidatus Tanganyikabacteria bacterium]
MLLIPDTPLSRRLATLGSILLAAVAVRLALGLVRPELGDAQTAIAGMTTAVLTAPTFHRWFGNGGALIPAERRFSYGLLCACSAMAFLVFVGLG